MYQWPTAASIICTGVSLSFSCSHSVSFPFLCSCAPLPNLICIVFSGLILEAPGHMLLLLNGSNQFWLPGMVTWEEPIKVLLRRRAIITALHGPKTWSLSLANDWKLRDKMTVQKTLIQTLRGPGTQLLDEDSPSGDWRLSRSFPLTGTLFNHSAVYREGDENDSVWHLREAYHYFREKLWNKKDRPFRGPFVETGSFSNDTT